MSENVKMGKKHRKYKNIQKYRKWERSKIIEMRHENTTEMLFERF